MLLVGMAREGVLKHVISTNTDGLHRRSGLDTTTQLTEIHGNSNLEDCPAEPVGGCDKPRAGGGCGGAFFRDERCRPAGLRAHEHAVGRACPDCGRDLQDTIINFGENLRAENVRRAREEAGKADVMLVLGSSLRVSTWPVELARRRGARVVVCNLQHTPFSESADLVVHARTDDAVRGLARALGVAAPPFVIARRLVVEPAAVNLGDLRAKVLRSELDRLAPGASAGCLEKSELTARLAARGAAPEAVTLRFETDGGRPFAVLRQCGALVGSGQAVVTPLAAAGGAAKGGLVDRATLAFFPGGGGGPLRLRLRLAAHFDEPVVELEHTPGTAAAYELEYEPGAAGGGWSVLRVAAPKH